jgi:putative PIN family toxin of toxin-antitoxin system
VVSTPILEEIERVMSYPKLQKVFSERRRKKLLMFIKRISLLVEPAFKLSVVEEDELDNRFLEAALESGAKVIIAGDRHLIELNRGKLLKVFPEGIEVLTPREFLDRCGNLEH